MTMSKNAALPGAASSAGLLSETNPAGLLSDTNPAGLLSPTQRGLYVAGGLLLAAAGAKPRPNPLLNVAALAVGSYLAWRGAEGSCPAKALLLGNTPEA